MPRLNKRAAREQENLASLQQPIPADLNASDDVESEPEIRPKLGFASLQVVDADSENDDADTPSSSAAKKSKSKKKKKKAKPSPAAAEEPEASTPLTPSTSAAPPVETPDPTTPVLSKKERKKAAKASRLDDIDQALRDLAVKDNPSVDPGQVKVEIKTRPNAAVQKFHELLAVSPKFLDGDAELRRFFGSKVVNSANQQTKKRNVTIRSQLTNPLPTWPMVRLSQGLSMRPLESVELRRKLSQYPGDTWFTIDHSPTYKSVELLFLETVQLGDYQGFMQILSQHPWHIDSLLQMSEVARHQEDNTQASDFVARSLFAYERSFSSQFNITTGTQRLDFDRIQNRPFFLALGRYVVNLQKRGTNRAAFEFARFLFSLEPGMDPHGALLYLDYLSVRAGMYQWIIELWDTWEDLIKEAAPTLNPLRRVDVRYLPGFMWSRALALWHVEEKAGDKNHMRSTNALKDAIHTYPSILPLIADKASINLSGDIRGDPAFRISTGWDFDAAGESTIHLLSHIYAQRSFDLWKLPEVGDWVRSAIDDSLLSRISSVTPSIRQQAIQEYEFGTPENFVRHVIVAENRSVMTFFSPNAVPQTMNAYDPVPPLTSLSHYNEEYFTAGGVDIVPRRPRRRGRGGGQEIPEDLGEEGMAQVQRMIMEEIRQRQARAQQEVPGAFHDPDDVDSLDDFDPNAIDDEIAQDESDDEEEDDSDEDVPAATGGFMQTLSNLLWRRGGGGTTNPEDH